MKTAFTLFISIVLFGCNNNALKSEVDLLTANQLKHNEEMLLEMNSFIEEHGKEGFGSQFQLVENFQTKHDSLLSFLKFLDSGNEKNLSSVSNEFYREIFSGYEISNTYPISITESTPRELIKLQLVSIENLVLREYKDGVSFRFNKMEAVIVPDKLNFKNNETITGTISMMAYSSDLEINAKINGIDIKGVGRVHFKIDPKSGKDQEELIVEVLFPNRVYKTSMDVNRE